MRIVVLLLALLVASPAWASITCPTAAAIPSVTSGYAPLAVHFDATTTDDSTTTRDFEDLRYVWDFDDLTAGTWAFSGQDKNVAYGGVAAHVYETPGTYDVVLTVTNAAGDSCNVTASAIVVGATTDTLTSTYCFSTDTDFTGCPGGATQVTQSNMNTIATSYMATNRRLLLHAGQTFTASAANLTTVAGPWMIASFGTGAKPIISTSHTSLLNIYNRSNVVLQDLDIRGTVGGSGTGNDLCGTYNRLIRVDVKTFNNNNSCDPNGGAWPFFHHVTWVDGVFTEFGGHNSFFGGTHFAIMGMDLGTFIGPTTAAGHNLRSTVLQKSVIQHNMFRAQDYDGFKHSLKWHSGQFDAAYSGQATYQQASEQSILSWNTFYGGAVNALVWVVTLTADNPADDMRHEEIVVESNYWVGATEGLGDMVTTSQLRFGGSTSTIRNNIFDAGTAAALPYNSVTVTQYGIGPAPQDNRVYNNTVVYRGGRTGFQAFNATCTSGCEFKNNLFYATSPSPSFGGDDTISNNVTDTSGSPFVNAEWDSPTDYKITAPNGDVIGAGTSVPSLMDFGARIWGGTWDVGAWSQDPAVDVPTHCCRLAADGEVRCDSHCGS